MINLSKDQQRVLEQLKHSVKAAFFVGTPVGVSPIENYERDDSFSGFFFDWESIKKKAKYFAVFHSDNDPYVCLANGQKLAEKLGVKLNFVPNAGHFNTKSGYSKFDQLLDEVSKVLKFK